MTGEACRHCGFLPQRPPKPIVFHNGDLALVDRQRRVAKPASDPNEHMRWHAMLTYFAGTRGYKPGWAAYKFKEKFGHWPPRIDPRPIEPSREVLSWIRSRNIAFAKSRKADAA